MNNRIRKFMEVQKLTPSELADNIGVQRSNVTHVLNGRNNPSFPFIEKLLKKYPKLSAKWLIMGEGEMMEGKPVFNASLFDSIQEPVIKSSQTITTDNIEEENKPAYTIQAPVKELITNNESKIIVKEKTDYQIDSVSSDKEIDKIFIFFTDQTFKAYRPSK